MKTSTTITSLVVLLLTTITQAAEDTGLKRLHFGEDGGDLSLLHLEAKPQTSNSLRGNSDSNSLENSLELPPIPPIHPHHTGVAHYSSTMDADGTIIYRRDIRTPCNNGLLVFNVGPSKDEMPYHWEVYADAYIWSDNGGLCILYPEYTAFQLSQYGPFWRKGIDPTTVTFTNLIDDFHVMHRISSRMLGPPEGAPEHTKQINHEKGGDYVMMFKGDFYDVGYYQRLKAFVNSWGPDGWGPHHEQEGWMILDGATTKVQ